VIADVEDLARAIERSRCRRDSHHALDDVVDVSEIAQQLALGKDRKRAAGDDALGKRK
jgi:hypothetical protein